MTGKLASKYFPLALIALALPVLGANPAAESGTEPHQVTNTQHIDFAPGGTIYIDRSYGVLHVEGWDRPEVAITVTKSLPYGYQRKHPDKAQQRLDALRVVAERRSATELSISTSKSSLGIVYEIQVPRDSSLAIHHRVGYVSVSGVAGDIGATCRRGDLVLWLPQKASYSIDARSRLGTVSSDFPGASSFNYPVGWRYSHADPPPSRQIFLRSPFGGITIQSILPESEAPIASGR